MKSYIHKGITYNVDFVHSGQYRPYGDCHRVLMIDTDANQDQTIEFLKDTFGYNSPHKRDWKPDTADGYFAGYYTMERTDNGWLYNKCEPYTD